MYDRRASIPTAERQLQEFLRGRPSKSLCNRGFTAGVGLEQVVSRQTSSTIILIRKVCLSSNSPGTFRIIPTPRYCIKALSLVKTQFSKLSLSDLMMSSIIVCSFESIMHLSMYTRMMTLCRQQTYGSVVDGIKSRVIRPSDSMSNQFLSACLRP